MVHLYKQYRCTNRTAVQNGTSVQTVKLYEQYSCTNSTSVQNGTSIQTVQLTNRTAVEQRPLHGGISDTSRYAVHSLRSQIVSLSL